MAHRNLWLIDMGDGTWAVCCMACRLALYRGAKRRRPSGRQPPLRTRHPPQPTPPKAPIGLVPSPDLGSRWATRARTHPSRTCRHRQPITACEGAACEPQLSHPSPQRSPGWGPAPGWDQPLPGWTPLIDHGPLPLRAAGSVARWWWPTLAVAGFLAVVVYVTSHDPGLSQRGLLTIALAALVVVLLTVHRTAGPGPLARAPPSTPSSPCWPPC